MKKKILVVDDEPALRLAIQDFLGPLGFELGEAANCRGAREAFRTFRPDAVVLDYCLPDGTALELLPELKSVDPSVPLILLTGHGSIELAVQAIKQGAEQFLTKPVELSALAVVLERSLENQQNRQRQLAGSSRQARESFDPFVGTSAAIRTVAEHADRARLSDYPILILGGTGSGKGVLAKWLHDHSSRSKEAFVDLNCAGLSRELLESELFGHEKGAFTGAHTSKPGLFEVAHRGTIFLDEIGDMDLPIQAKLLTVLDEKRFRRLGNVRDRQVDVRLIAATHQDLSSLVREQKFRSDLYFRVSTVVLRVPPLRERLEDIPLLTQQILDRIAAELGRRRIELLPEALEALASYSWPGNVREVRNVLERSVLLAAGDVLRRRDLRFEIPPGGQPTGDESNLTLEELERLHIGRVLEEENGRVGPAAMRLGISRASLYSKIKVLQITLSGRKREASSK